MTTAPAVSDIGQAITNTLQQNEVTFIQVTLPDGGMTLSIDVTVGVVVTYGSNKIQNPNEAFYDFKLANSRPEIFVTTDTFGSIEIANFTNITVYISIQGQSATNQFTLNTTIGDTTTGILCTACNLQQNQLIYCYIFCRCSSNQCCNIHWCRKSVWSSGHLCGYHCFCLYHLQQTKEQQAICVRYCQQSAYIAIL